MSAGFPCTCNPQDRDQWRVMQRNCNHFALNGYRYTPSAYSSVTCLKCQRIWRTAGKYVRLLKDYIR